MIQQLLEKLHRLPLERQEHYMRMALMLFELGETSEASSDVLSDAPPPHTKDG